MGRPDSILGQFGETVRCRDAQHGDGVCCAFAPQLVLLDLERVPKRYGRCSCCCYQILENSLMLCLFVNTQPIIIKLQKDSELMYYPSMCHLGFLC